MRVQGNLKTNLVIEYHQGKGEDKIQHGLDIKTAAVVNKS